MRLTGRLRQLLESRAKKIYILADKYHRLKRKMGKTAVLDKLKMYIRRLPGEEEQVLIAADVVFELAGEEGMPYVEVVRKVMCLTGLPESKVEDLLPGAFEELGVANMIVSEEKIFEELSKKGDVIDEYCDVLLKRRFRRRVAKG